MFELFFFRIVFAGIAGFIIGTLSRTVSTARVFAIVCMGAALVIITSTEFYRISSYPWISDPGRLSAQVISALGFIGTGLIWISTEDKRIKGLSNAANLWVTAIIGMLIGAGLQNAAIAGTFAVTIIYWAANNIIKCNKLPNRLKSRK